VFRVGLDKSSSLICFAVFAHLLQHGNRRSRPQQLEGLPGQSLPGLVRAGKSRLSPHARFSKAAASQSFVRLTPESRLTDPDPRDNIVCLSISRTALAHQSGLASLSADLGFAERTAGVLGWREGRSRRSPTQMVKGLLAGMEEECRSAKLKGSQPLVDLITPMSAAHHSRVNGLETSF
jgi:hypothetical protein